MVPALYALFVVGVVLTVLCTLACDVNELLGMRQAVEGALVPSEAEYDPPIRKKDVSTRALFGHSRHPIFLGPALVFFSVPFMTLDRFVVALWLIAYMVLRNDLDEVDVAFVARSATERVGQVLRERPGRRNY
jgi:steroid 5-alpha reductase family enzyme